MDKLNQKDSLVLNEKRKKIKDEKKLLTIEEDLKDWIFHLKEQLSKRNYKKVSKNIVSAGLINKFKNTPGGHKIIILYIQSKLKIIENKIFKYHFNPIENSNKQKHQISRCFHYSSNIQKELDLLLQGIQNNNLYDNNYYNDINKRNYKIELLDDIIRCHFDYIYIISLLHYKIGNYIEAISYLGLSLTLYKDTKLFILSNHTLNKIEKCFILLSKIYIINKDYDNAFLFLKEAIKVCFRQILFQVQELFYGVYVGEKDDLLIKENNDLLLLKDYKIKKIIINIIIVFFYHGICKEHLFNIKKATAFYKQCEWFSRIFLSKSNEDFYKLFYKLKIDGIKACYIIEFLQEKIEKYEEKENQKKLENNDTKKKYFLKKEKLFNSKKFKGLIKRLQELKIKEIDTKNKFEKNRNIRCISAEKREGRREGKYKSLYLSNLRLLEAYLRADFKNIINVMNKINIFDLDYKTREMVQKTLNKIYFEQNQKIIRERRNKMSKEKMVLIKYNENEKNNNNNKDNNELSINDINYFDSFSFSDFQKQKNQKNKRNNIYLSKFRMSKNNSLNILLKDNDSNFNNINKFNRKFFVSKKEEINSPKSQKFQYSSSSSFILNSSRYPRNKKIGNNIDKNKSTSPTKINKSGKYRLIIQENHKLNEFFNLKYLRKRNYIKKLTDRDLLFQKSVLKSKNTPKFSFKYFNRAEAYQNADNSFSMIESLVSNRANNDWKENLSEEEYKEYLLNNKLKNILLTSLDNKALSNYKNNLKIKKKKLDLQDNIFKNDKKIENINKNNQKTLHELNLKLNEIYLNELKRNNEIEEHKKEINREMYKKFHRNKSALNRSNIRDNFSKKLRTYQSFANFSKRNSVNKSQLYL